jgi:ABC-2 type transport system permease protein
VADEQKTGTLEVLMTKPIRDWELVLGKWLGACFLHSYSAPHWIYPLILNIVVKPGIEMGSVITGYLGLLLLIGSSSPSGFLLLLCFQPDRRILYHSGHPVDLLVN